MNRVESLVPIENIYRHSQSLAGDWYIAFGWQSEANYEKGVPKKEHIPLPGSFREMYIDRNHTYFLGAVWYEKLVFIPKSWLGQEVFLRFSYIPERISIYINGVRVGYSGVQEERITFECAKYLRYDEQNSIVIKSIAQDVSYRTGGLTMDIDIVSVPTTRLLDIAWLPMEKKEDTLHLPYLAKVQGNSVVTTTLRNREGRIVATAIGGNASLSIEHPEFWSVGNPYLYSVDFEVSRLGKQTDCYTMPVGLRENLALPDVMKVAITSWKQEATWQKRHLLMMKRYGYTALHVTDREMSDSIAKMTMQEGMNICLQLPLEPIEIIREVTFFEKEGERINRNIIQVQLMEEYKNCCAVIAWHIALPSIYNATKDLLPSYLNILSGELDSMERYHRPIILEVSLEAVSQWESLFAYVDAVVIRVAPVTIGARTKEGGDTFVQLAQKVEEIRSKYANIKVYPLWNMRTLKTTEQLLLMDGKDAFDAIQSPAGRWVEGDVERIGALQRTVR